MAAHGGVGGNRSSGISGSGGNGGDRGDLVPPSSSPPSSSSSTSPPSASPSSVPSSSTSSSLSAIARGGGVGGGGNRSPSPSPHHHRESNQYSPHSSSAATSFRVTAVRESGSDGGVQARRGEGNAQLAAGGETDNLDGDILSSPFPQRDYQQGQPLLAPSPSSSSLSFPTPARNAAGVGAGVAPAPLGISLVGDQVVAHPDAISSGVPQSAPSIPRDSRDSINGGLLAQPAVEGNAQRGRLPLSAESLARAAEVVRAAGVDGTTAQSVVTLLTNILAQGTHSVPHTAAAHTSVAPPVQRQSQVQAADGSWARGLEGTHQAGALLPNGAGGNNSNNNPAQAGSGVTGSPLHSSPFGVGDHAAGGAATAAASGVRPNAVEVSPHDDSVRHDGGPAVSEPLTRARDDAEASSNSGAASATATTSFDPSRAQDAGGSSRGAAVGPGEHVTVPPPWVYSYQPPPPWWLGQQQSSDNAALRLPELAKKEHRLTFAGEKDALSLADFLKEKENTLHTYLRAGKLDWKRAADRIAVFDWLGSALTGTARTWWDSISYRANPVTGQMEQFRLWESLEDWDQLVAAFKAKWERPTDVAAAHAEFYRNTVQRAGEALHDFNARFDSAAGRAKVTDPNSLAVTYWYGLQRGLRDEIVRYLHQHRGEAAALNATNLSLLQLREVAREVVTLSTLTRSSPHLSSGLPPPSYQAKGALHAVEGSYFDEVADEDENSEYRGDYQSSPQVLTQGPGESRVYVDGAFNTYNGARSRNSVSNSVYNSTVSVSNANRKRKASSFSQQQSMGRNRYPPSSPATSRSGTPQRAPQSPTSRPPAYQRSPQHSVGAGGGSNTSDGLSADQIQGVQAMRGRWRGKLDRIPDGQLYARMQQQACLLCGGRDHKANSCPTDQSGGAGAGGVKMEYPKGEARRDRR